MKLPYSEPDPAGSERAKLSKQYRDLATEVARLRPQALTEANREEEDHGPEYPANFTKGLAHDDCGILQYTEDYHCFVAAINSPDRTLFDKGVETAETRGIDYHCKTKKTCHGKQTVKWRGWESPRSGHVYELEGADSGACGMAPAPRIGSSELAAEMAEVYGLAILRDVPFTTISKGGGDKLCVSTEKPGQAAAGGCRSISHGRKGLLAPTRGACGTLQRAGDALPI